MDKQFHAIIEAAVALLIGLSPAALGAAVSLAYEKGLTWTERFVQFAVGVIVSYFAGNVIGAIWSLDAFVLEGIKFTLAMIAFKAAPKFISSSVDALATLPGDAVASLVSWLPKKKDVE